MAPIYSKRNSNEWIYPSALLLIAGLAGGAGASRNEGRVSGTITDAVTRKPVPLAFITVAGSKLPPVASDADGFFITYELTAAPHTLRVSHSAYRATQVPVTVQPEKILQVQIELTPVAKKSRFLISVYSQKLPVSAKIRLRGPVEEEISTSGGIALAEVPAGRYSASVTAEGYLAQSREAQLADGAEQPLAFDLRPAPAKRAVSIKGKKIEVGHRIRFAPGRAVILPDSTLVLDELIDAIVRNDIRRVRVEGHTDSEGSAAKNLVLSEQRARAVASYLAKSGIDGGRIEIKGYGDSRPVVPNLTPRARELNRRMEFYILDGLR